MTDAARGTFATRVPVREHVFLTLTPVQLTRSRCVDAGDVAELSGERLLRPIQSDAELSEIRLQPSRNSERVP